MAANNVPSLGRFSSQMLTYLGTQRTVKNVTGTLVNTFKYSYGPTTFPSPGSISQAALGAGVVGSYSLEAYNSTKCYYLSRGASEVYADTMTGLTIDIATILGISPAELLVKSEVNGTTSLTQDAYKAFNLLRSNGNQVGTAASVNNKNSLQASQIRS
jgi:hypothetical protein